MGDSRKAYYDDLEDQGQVLDLLEKDLDLRFVGNLYKELETFEKTARLKAQQFKEIQNIKNSLVTIIRMSCPAYISGHNVHDALKQNN